MDTLCNYFKT